MNKTGAVARAILELMDGGLSHAELARLVMQRFPGEFRDEKEALQTAADLSERYWSRPSRTTPTSLTKLLMGCGSVRQQDREGGSLIVSAEWCCATAWRKPHQPERSAASPAVQLCHTYPRSHRVTRARNACHNAKLSLPCGTGLGHAARRRNCFSVADADIWKP